MFQHFLDAFKQNDSCVCVCVFYMAFLVVLGIISLPQATQSYPEAELPSL